MRELRTETIIHASAERIWQILIDFDRYPEWNPFVISILGRPKLRERLKVTLLNTKGKPTTFQPKITLLKKNQVFGWLGNLWIVGLFDGHHIFEIQEMEQGRCRFLHREEFSGLLVPLFWKSLDTKVRTGFEAMNEKLKSMAETVSEDQKL